MAARALAAEVPAWHHDAVWDPGSTIVHQEVWQGRVWAARPLTVIEDIADRMLLWIPKGTVRKVPATPPSRPDPLTRHARIIENLDRCDWVLGEHVWDVSSLWILHPGDWHAIWVSWKEPGVHLGWYVDLQRPFRRTDIGIEAMDLILDVVVEPDMSWRWKDNDEFDEIVEREVFERPTSERVRQAAATVIQRIEQVAPPFSEHWPSWRPNTEWPTPVLPKGWDDSCL